MPDHTPPQRRRHAKRRGTAYVLVLSITSLLVMLGLTASQLVRTEISNNSRLEDQAAVQLSAMSALDIMHKRLDGETAWRSSTAHDAWDTGEKIDGVLVQFKFIDETDGNLSSDNTHRFRLYAMATRNDARRLYSVELMPDASFNLRRNPTTLRRETVD